MSKFRFCRVVLRDSNAAATMRENSTPPPNRGEVLEMSDRYWIAAANPITEPILSKIRTVFGVEMSRQSTHFSGAGKTMIKRLPYATWNDTRPAARCDKTAWP